MTDDEKRNRKYTSGNTERYKTRPRHDETEPRGGRDKTRQRQDEIEIMDVVEIISYDIHKTTSKSKKLCT